MTIILTVISALTIEPNADGNFGIRKKIDSNNFNFLWLGDWGGWPAPAYTTPIQLSVAKSMERTAREWKPEFVFGLGDNFYYWGITDVNDKMFTKTFENVYTSKELHVPWHFTTGNHDFQDGNGTAQLAYSEISHRWTYPSFYYTIDYELEGASMRIVVIDTTLLCGVIRGGIDGNPLDREYADQMWAWIQKTLSESDNFEYLFVTGHYQVLDNRGYYDANLVEHLLPLMKRYNVSAYVQGHWHTMEHNQEQGFGNEDDVHFFTIGCGALLAGVLNNGCKTEEVECYHYWDGGLYTGAYSYTTVSPEKATFTMIESENDTVLYTYSILPRKLIK